jgi:outer membrane protein assembly factor BamD (BamD/ComL family)
MARNYRNAGIRNEAIRCLKSIISEYPDSKWAADARKMLVEIRKPPPPEMY